MKKIFAWLLVLTMLLSFSACGSEPLETTLTTEAKSGVNRCVIYVASLADILDAFGKTDCIVGAYGTLAESYNVSSCGKWNEVDVEAVYVTCALVMPA